MSAFDRQTLGNTGENIACRELRRRGYAILARRYRTRVGEIDIVARDGPTTVFVEVKTRTGVTCGLPGEAVGPRKQRTIRLMAADYLMRRGWLDRPCRFDVVAVTMRGGRVQKLEVFTGAFEGR